MELIIRKYALENAVKHNGKAQIGSVIGSIIQEKPEVKKNIQKIKEEVIRIVEEVNSTNKENQLEELKHIAPELLEKKKEEKDIFESLKLPKKQGLVTAFPPGPEKYPHLGHAKACILNYLLAKKHNGKFILRFEDTNPNLVKKEFYEIFEENLSWLGVEWDKLQYASDNMELFYKMGEKLIRRGHAYVCFCEQNKIKQSRKTGKECKCRKKSAKENLKAWREMKNYEEGSCVVRMKIDLKHKNTTMRDPAIFRIIESRHARLGNEYKIWPNYDFQNAVMDGYYGVDFRIRSKEFELRGELQNYIQKLLRLKQTKTYEIARFEIKGVPSSGRIIREMIESNKLMGWDDPQLTTLVALKRRGFKPEAIVDFLISTGISKAESVLEWDDLIIHNKRLLDKEAKRYFFIEEPRKIIIENSPKINAKIPLHPENKRLGFREFRTGNEFYIEEKDLEKIQKMGDNSMIRLMDCINFIKKNNKFTFHSAEYKNYKSHKGNKIIIHWLPADNENKKNLINVEILMPDHEIKKGLGSSYLKKIKTEDVIQFERFGFCKLDSEEKRVMKFWFTHK
ncbi:glutamate--tRNA ligase [Candidatus Woesearchaeota archaeon]|nr:glutamate--tRNA ligase [Candidatus Woesearchaeota archaeon]